MSHDNWFQPDELSINYVKEFSRAERAETFLEMIRITLMCSPFKNTVWGKKINNLIKQYKKESTT